MLRSTLFLTIAGLLAVTGVYGDLILLPGTKITFGDSTEQDTAATAGGGPIPAGHGGTNNSVAGTDAYIGGGNGNSTTQGFASISGGSANSAGAQYTTVGGGRQNNVSSTGTYGTAGGGWGNLVSGYAATIAGGRSNTASGTFSVVPGGLSNTAAGNYSFAAGRRAKSNAVGSTTFTDSLDQDFGNNQTNSFAVRATGGVFFFTKVNGGTEVFQLNSAGQGSFSDDLFVDGDVVASGSHVRPPSLAAARDPRTIDPETLLEKAVTVPVLQYTSEEDGQIRSHVGFIAEEFNAAFELGGDPAVISLLDVDAVAIASIQALYDKLESREERIASLEQTLATVSKRLDALESGVSGR